MPHSEIKIQNIVATTQLGKDIDLTKLAKTLPNTEYNPEKFPGLVLRIKNPKASLLLFSNGKVVCTGTKSETELNQAIAQLDKII